MSKFTKSQARQMVEDGKAEEYTFELKGFELPNGNILWEQDGSEELMDSHIAAYDNNGVVTQERVRKRGPGAWIQQKIHRARTVGAAISSLLDLDPVKALLEHKGVDIEKLIEGLDLLKDGTAEARLRFAMRRVPSNKMNEVFDLFVKAKEDGHISADEWTNILGRVG